jgi:hypothetical protein
MDTNEDNNCLNEDNKKDSLSNKKEKKSLTEKLVDSIQKDIITIIQTVKETENRS